MNPVRGIWLEHFSQTRSQQRVKGIRRRGQGRLPSRHAASAGGRRGARPGAAATEESGWGAARTGGR